MLNLIIHDRRAASFLTKGCNEIIVGANPKNKNCNQNIFYLKAENYQNEAGLASG